MSHDIADEVKMILDLPHIGQIIGVVFIVVGVLQISLLSIKQLILHYFCSNNIEAIDSDKSAKGGAVSSQEVSQLIQLQQKPKNGVMLIDNKERDVST